MEEGSRGASVAPSALESCRPDAREACLAGLSQAFRRLQKASDLLPNAIRTAFRPSHEPLLSDRRTKARRAPALHVLSRWGSILVANAGLRKASSSKVAQSASCSSKRHSIEWNHLLSIYTMTCLWPSIPITHIS